MTRYRDGGVSCVVVTWFLRISTVSPQYSAIHFYSSLTERPWKSVNINTVLYFTVLRFTSIADVPPQIAVNKQVALYRGWTLPTVCSVTSAAVNWEWRFVGVSGFDLIYMQEELGLCVCVRARVPTCVCMYVFFIYY